MTCFGVFYWPLFIPGIFCIGKYFVYAIAFMLLFVVSMYFPAGVVWFYILKEKYDEHKLKKASENRIIDAEYVIETE